MAGLRNFETTWLWCDGCAEMAHFPPGIFDGERSAEVQTCEDGHERRIEGATK